MYKKIRESEYLDIINSLNFPQEISQLIQEYTFDINIFKRQWFNRMIETHSILDKGYKLVPIYSFHTGDIKKKYYCMECYMDSFVNKTTYMTNIECYFCEHFFKLQIYIDNDAGIINNNISNVISPFNKNSITYDILSFDEMINREELKNMYYLYGYNISTLLKSSKLLSEFVFLNKQNHFQTKFIRSGLKYEIMIPAYWKIINKKIKSQYRLSRNYNH